MAVDTIPEVHVTGLGAVSCLGTGVDAFWAGLTSAAPRPTPVAGLTDRVPDILAYQVPDGPELSPRAGEPHGQVTRLALHAARQAMADAGLSEDETADMAVVIGTAAGESGERDGLSSPAAGWAPVFRLASEVGGELGAFGTNINVSNACAASGYALSVAMDIVRRGEADTVLVGGAEALSWAPLASFSRLGANDPELCRPFDTDRRGTVFGEGAAMLVVQSARAAAGRPSYGRLRGTGWSCDAHHLTAPDPAGDQPLRAAREALREAADSAEDIGCVVPHGTGTEYNDVLETRVLREVLGEHLERVPLFSLKAFIGHTAGAAAAFAVVAAALMCRHALVPANIAPQRQDPACPVWLPRTGPVRLERPRILLNAYAFGGSNVSLVFGGETR
ncbi:beta-ketoacyl-[acyl-carrier-protein] synthase family protein [Streptomyces prunicolor]|uniref:beta-ketoacyl-[acyl-carrier-protein] synthase family protein n=1 Tax=Streptomyces prunicolor TaxID=67348 RepID=UPI0038635D0A|nr:beta-ketoacyl-[acyl-carrier-protein] synthase family protein [Streptomyces prunicolor]